MDEKLNLLFRPSLIICVGETGAFIREHLSPYGSNGNGQSKASRSLYHLLANVDEPLQQCIGLLQVKTEGEGANPNEAIPFPVLETFPDDPEMPKEPASLEESIYRSIVSVQREWRLLEVKSRGYNAPNTRTQIFIVGEPTSKNMRWMSKILGIVRELTRKYHFESPVFYFLNSYHIDKDYSDTLMKPLSKPGLKWSGFELTNFGYLYEHLISYPTPTFLTQSEVQYATAEALLALVASGITTMPVFENEMELPSNVEDYANHIGNFNTSMIQFPRTTVRRFCSSRLASELMQEWSHTLNQSTVSDQQLRELKNQARQRVGDIVSWMGDRQERPAAEGVQWPSLAILRRPNHPKSEREMNQQRAIHNQLIGQTEKLFQVFSQEDVDREYKAQRVKTKTWDEVAYERCGRAVGFYPTWERYAKSAWDVASDRIGAEVKRDIDTLWSRDTNGFENARVFVDELDDQLAELMTEVVHWRQAHDATYTEDRQDFLRKADGEWVISEDESNIKGQDKDAGSTGQATPTMGGMPSSTPAAFTNAIPVAGGSPGGGSPGGGFPNSPQHLPPLEETIGTNLRRRTHWKQGLVPSGASLFTAGFVSWLAAAFTLPQLNLPMQMLIAADITVATLILVASLSLSFRRRREFRQAQKDTLAFYRRYYVYHCEKREDLQRISLMRMLTGRVMRMRYRFDHLAAFFQNVQSRSDKAADEVVKQLFEGPAIVRDIFIANGEQLERTGPHTLDTIVQKVTNSRINHPLEDWHSSLTRIKAELIRKLGLSPESLFEMDEEAVADYLLSFNANIIDGYLSGTLVAINAALDKPDVWKEILERVRKPLYYASVGIREPQLIFVCGSATDLVRSSPYLPPEAIRVQTKSSEWLMVGAFFRGGKPTAFNATELFPPKKLEAPPSPGSGNPPNPGALAPMPSGSGLSPMPGAAASPSGSGLSPISGAAASPSGSGVLPLPGAAASPSGSGLLPGAAVSPTESGIQRASRPSGHIRPRGSVMPTPGSEMPPTSRDDDDEDITMKWE